MALAESIRREGLHNPIWLYEGAILDGKTRFEACGIASVEPRFEIFSGDDPVRFTISQNRLRRHMQIGELLLIVAALCKLRQHLHGRNKHLSRQGLARPCLQEEKTAEELAKEAGIGRSNIVAAKTVLQNGEENVVEMVRAGAVGAQSAARFVRNTPREQQRNATVNDVKQARHRENDGRRPKRDVPVWGKHNRPVIIPSKKTLAERKKPQPMLTIPSRDLTERLAPIIKTLKQQSKCSMATVSFTTLAVLAGELEHLVEEWTSGGTGSERTPNSANSIALNERKAL